MKAAIIISLIVGVLLCTLETIHAKADRAEFMGVYIGQNIEDAHKSIQSYISNKTNPYKYINESGGNSKFDTSIYNKYKVSKIDWVGPPAGWFNVLVDGDDVITVGTNDSDKKVFEISISDKALGASSKDFIWDGNLNAPDNDFFSNLLLNGCSGTEDLTSRSSGQDSLYPECKTKISVITHKTDSGECYLQCGNTRVLATFIFDKPLKNNDGKTSYHIKRVDLQEFK